jgi:hypothetical protein
MTTLAKAVVGFSNSIPVMSDISERELGVPAVALVPLSVTDAAYAFVPVTEALAFTPAPKTVLPVVIIESRFALCAGGRATFHTTWLVGVGVGVEMGVGVGVLPPAEGEPPPPQPPNNREAKNKTHGHDWSFTCHGRDSPYLGFTPYSSLPIGGRLGGEHTRTMP